MGDVDRRKLGFVAQNNVADIKRIYRNPLTQRQRKNMAGSQEKSYRHGNNRATTCLCHRKLLRGSFSLSGTVLGSHNYG